MQSTTSTGWTRDTGGGAEVLDYGGEKKRRFTRRACLAGTAAIAAGVAMRYRGALWRRVEVERQYRQLLQYALPPDTVVYTMDMVEGRSLLQKSGAYQLVHGLSNRQDKVIFRPSILTNYLHGTSHRGGGAVVFLHGRRSRAGAVRVVGVEMGAVADCVIFEAWVGGRNSGAFFPTGDPTKHGLSRPLVLHNGDMVRAFAGAPDPSDESRFSIVLEVNGVRNRLSGRLRDDGTVKLWPQTGRLVYFAGRLDGGWCPDGSNREASGLDSPVSLSAPPD